MSYFREQGEAVAPLQASGCWLIIYCCDVRDGLYFVTTLRENNIQTRNDNERNLMLL